MKDNQEIKRNILTIASCYNKWVGVSFLESFNYFDFTSQLRSFFLFKIIIIGEKQEC